MPGETERKIELVGERKERTDYSGREGHEWGFVGTVASMTRRTRNHAGLSTRTLLQA